MYRPQRPANQPPQASHRLPKQQSMPTVNDLGFAHDEAKKRAGACVELPWGTDSSNTFVITCVVPERPPGQDPLWSLYQGDSMQTLLWKHVSRDMALVHSLIFQAVPDDVAVGGGFGTPSAGFGSGGGSSSGSAGAGALPVIGPPADTSKASLTGRIENMQMATLVQSIQMSKMSGRLFLFDKGETAQIFFSDGSPVHATTVEATGDHALVETMTWEEGDFRFFPEETTTEKTITRRLDAALMEGITLLDQKKFLSAQNMKPESYLVRRDMQITADEFRSRLSRGAPLDMALQKAFYDMSDGRTRLSDILQRRHLTKAEWIPLLFNMVSCGLVGLSDVSPFTGQASGLAGTDIDRSMIQNVLRSLVRGDTGMFTYPAFLFFLEQEFAKSVVLGIPLSILIFEIRIGKPGEAPQPLPIPALREVASRIEALKRPFDILAHYETFDIALIIPGAPAKKARALANLINDKLVNSPLIPNSTARLFLAGGIACAPEDSQDMSKLMSAAREAKNKAKEQRLPAKMFSELSEKH